MSVSFMLGLLGLDRNKQRYWVPFTKDVKVRNCADPPPKPDVAQELILLMQQRARTSSDPIPEGFHDTIEMIRLHLPEKRWMLTMIATFNTEHRYFDKDFVKPQVIKKNQKPEVLIDNSHGFLTGLPQAKRSRKKTSMTFQARDRKKRRPVQDNAEHAN